MGACKTSQTRHFFSASLSITDQSAVKEGLNQALFFFLHRWECSLQSRAAGSSCFSIRCSRMNSLRIAEAMQSEGLARQVKSINNISARLVAFLLVALALNQWPEAGARAAGHARRT